MYSEESSKHGLVKISYTQQNYQKERPFCNGNDHPITQWGQHYCELLQGLRHQNSGIYLKVADEIKIPFSPDSINFEH